nr:uncharacterized protein LOC113814931 [Penaeus vannamei]
MRTCRISPRSLGTKILFLAGLAIWTIIGALLDVVERESVNYVDDPWYDWMDKKRYRPLPGRNVTYAKIQTDQEELNVFIRRRGLPRVDAQTPGGAAGGVVEHLQEDDGPRGILQLQGLSDLPRRRKQIHLFRSGRKPHPGDCLIYSFGVGGEVSWDTAMVHLNCSVFAFDMTSKTWDNGMLIENLHFLALGLGPDNVDADIQMHNATHPNRRDEKKSFFRTLETVRDFLGHSERAIDVLKLDIEFAEWDFFESLFRSPRSRGFCRMSADCVGEKREKRRKRKRWKDSAGCQADCVHLDDLKHESAAKRVRGGQRVERILETLQSHGFHLVHTELNTAFQVFADVRGEVLPLFRESLYVRRP